MSGVTGGRIMTETLMAVTLMQPLPQGPDLIGHSYESSYWLV